ncbi:pulmonary surfactant-associated protein D-like [Thalassophryne amazonica]|uniref:pulmonary surfactant-associated protein D-like n=1 Tax=Thalassophryne amazonica TaxID=390379 RepID=UPI0014720B1A|nr:pulmonary surfactant-associated protein D-like [Thalassophryne amazonica]
MLKLMLLFLTLSGLNAIPIASLRRLQKIPLANQIADGFQQGTEPFGKLPVDLDASLGQEHMSERDTRALTGKGFGEMERRHWLKDEVHVEVPLQKNGGGWVRVEEYASSHLASGFNQGTEPSHRIPDGFRQGTEPSHRIPDGFRQGTEPSHRIPDGFKQGTEPSHRIPDGFRQGTEPVLTIPEGFRQGTEPSTSKFQIGSMACKGEIINGNCYEFNPAPLNFHDAQSSCRGVAPNAQLASVTSGDLLSRLVSMVTGGGENNPVLTWLGGMVKNQKASWVDGSEWNYDDWMPGHPNIHANKPTCVEMFREDQSWWTTADCELKRASICSYPIAA